MQKLSVIIPAYNAEKFITLALQSLMNQTETDFEVIVIDDGSKDGTAQIAESFANSSGPNVQVIRQKNAGVSAARNVGMRAAKTPLIGFLDADDVWHQTKVSRHLQAMETHPDVDLTFSSFGYIDDAGNALIDQSILTEGHYEHDDLLPRNFIHTSTVIARRDALLAVGGFDEALKTYEDFDLWLRVAERRPSNLYAIHDRLADYRRHETQTTGQWRKMNEGWTQVTQRLARDHPVAWSKVASRAHSQHYEYCASLAYNAGDVRQTRALMMRAWQADHFGLLTQKNSTIMLGIALASYLPRPIQIAIGWTFTKTRLAKRWVHARIA